MKHRLIRALAALGILTAPLALTLAPDAKADHLVSGVPDVVDLTVDVTIEPQATIAPVGAGAVFRVDVGAAPLTIGESTLTGELADGLIYTGSFPASACTADGQTVTCDVPAGGGVIDIKAKSTATGDYPFTASVASNDPAIAAAEAALQDTEDNTETVTLTVADTVDDGDAYAYVCAGCSITFEDSEIGTATLTAPNEGDPENTNGVFVRLEVDDSIEGQSCGTLEGEPVTCGVALGVVFDEDEEGYQVEDETNPVEVDYTPVQPPCRGLNRCAPLGYYDPTKDPIGPEGDPKPLPDCDGAGTGDNPGDGIARVDGEYHVCRDSSDKEGSKLVSHLVLMRSNDPLLPPLGVG